MNIKETRINFKALIVWIEDQYEYFFFLQNSKFLYQKSILGGLLKQIKITIFFFKTVVEKINLWRHLVPTLHNGINTLVLNNTTGF